MTVAQRLQVVGHGVAAVLVVVGIAATLDLLGLVEVDRRAQGLSVAALSSAFGVGAARRRADTFKSPATRSEP